MIVWSGLGVWCVGGECSGTHMYVYMYEYRNEHQLVLA